MSLKLKEDRIFASVLADGLIHVNAPEGTEGAKVRKYKTSDGKEGSKTELVYTELIGKITSIDFYEGDYGRQLQVTITDGEDTPVVLSLSTNSPYGEDLMKKLINVDLERNVKIVPYSFVDDKKKNKKGITVWQKNLTTGKTEKLTNYFYDPVNNKNVNGYPEPKNKGKKALSKDQWKIYFAEAREFLVEEIKKHFKIDENRSPVSKSAADEEFDNF